jgi:hypothetical protein
MIIKTIASPLTVSKAAFRPLTVVSVAGGRMLAIGFICCRFSEKYQAI